MNKTPKQSDLEDEISRLRREMEAQRSAFHASIPKLIGESQLRLEKVETFIAAIQMYETNIKNQLSQLKIENKIAFDIAVTAMEFFTEQNLKLIEQARVICQQPYSIDGQTAPPPTPDDFVFSEFKLNSLSKKLTISNKVIQLPTVEFQYLLQFVKNPNQEVQFDNPKLARVNIGRLKHRVPELDALIVAAYGKSSYRLAVTPITSK